MKGIYRNSSETTNARYTEIWILFALAAAAFVAYSLYTIVSNVAATLTRALQM